MQNTHNKSIRFRRFHRNVCDQKNKYKKYLMSIEKPQMEFGIKGEHVKTLVRMEYLYVSMNGLFKCLIRCVEFNYAKISYFPIIPCSYFLLQISLYQNHLLFESHTSKIFIQFSETGRLKQFSAFSIRFL